MTLIFEDESGVEGLESRRELAERVINMSLDVLNCPYEACVSLTLTTSGPIREINRTYREIDQETDVLSFPMLDFAYPGDFSFIDSFSDNEAAGAFDPDSGELLLGDIVINMDRVFSQSRQYGHSVRREFAFLITHSMLHLAGYDHMDPDDAPRMEEKQEEILDKLGIRRDSAG